MRVLLTGSAGFIGSEIAAQLTRRGHEVVGVDAMISQAHVPGSSPPSGASRFVTTTSTGRTCLQTLPMPAWQRSSVRRWSMRDVAAANVAAIDKLAGHPVGVTAYNVCSGQPFTVGQMAGVVAAASGGPEPVSTGAFRAADVRHVVADPARARDGLGFRATIPPEQGLLEFATAPLRATR